MIILKNETGDFIYLDVVTQYSRNFSSQMTQHPVDGSGTVSDNVVTQNPKYQIVGNITGADFNSTSSKPELNSDERSFIGIDQIVVESDRASIIEVKYDSNPTNLLPDVAGQFFSDSLPRIENLNEGRDAVYSERILFDVLKKFRDRKEKLSLYEFDNNIVIGEPLDNMFIVSLTINETASTGDSLTFDITIEQATVSNLLEEEIPEDVQEDFKKKAKEQEKLGDKPTVDAEGNPVEVRPNSGLSRFFELTGGVSGG